MRQTLLILACNPTIRAEQAEVGLRQLVIIVYSALALAPSPNSPFQKPPLGLLGGPVRVGVILAGSMLLLSSRYLTAGDSAGKLYMETQN